MNGIPELVDLPDPAVQPLVHPLDLPGARRWQRASWLIGALTAPGVALGVAAVVWSARGGVAVALVAGASTLVLGALAGRHAAAQAWDHIPRRRQDRDRPLPLRWDVGGELILATALAAALSAAALRGAGADLPAGVRDVVLGGGIGVAVLMAAQVAGRLAAGRWRAAVPALPTLAVVVTAVAVAVPRGGAPSPALVGGGAAMLLATGAVAAAVDAARRRGLGATRQADGPGATDPVVRTCWTSKSTGRSSWS